MPSYRQDLGAIHAELHEMNERLERIATALEKNVPG